MRLFYVLHEVINTVVIKAHAVDQTFGIDQAEDPWLIVARLRTRRHGTNFNGTKTHRPERINALAVLIQPGGQAQRVLKCEPHTGYRLCRHLLANQHFQRGTRNTA